MKVDPAVVQIFAENVRADIIRRPAGLNLDAAIVQKIASKVQVFRGMTPDCLMSTLDIGSSFHVLISGEVVIEKERNGQVVPLARLGPGECFGEMALVGSPLRSASVRALRDSVTMRFDRERVDSYPDSAHIIYRNIARILSARLDTSSEMLTELTLRGSDPA